MPHLQVCQRILRFCTAGQQRLFSRPPNTSQEWTQVRPTSSATVHLVASALPVQPALPFTASVLPAAALAMLIEENGVPDQPPKGLLPKGFTNLFHTLSKTILYQQLAGAAASTIHARFMDLIHVGIPAACPLLLEQRHSVNCLATDEAVCQAIVRRSSA